jgi:DNA (cytosine-5)-methyltransferase 1
MKAFVGFAGFGLVDLVLREAAFDTIGVEIDPAITEVNRINGVHCLTADILDIRPEDYIDYDLAHFSPPCPNFSLASQSEETETDIALARWVARFVAVVKPEIFTLENVWLYRKSKSWGIILEALTGMGYGVDWWHLNAADYGVAQSRKRMIVIGRFDGQRPQKPVATHRDASKDNAGQVALFETLPPWVGWYEVIKDLIPTLPESQFAPWQMDRMPEELKTFLAPVNGEHSNGLNVSDPEMTITTSHDAKKYRAFLLGQGERSKIKNGTMPADTVQAGVKSFIINSRNTNRDLTIRVQDQPAMSVTASDMRRPSAIQRAAAQGRIVSMTPRALARFQGIPDSFRLPDNRTLACYGIGNAVPPPLYRAVLKSLERR